MAPSLIQTSAPRTVDRLQYGLDAGVALCIGLIPVFHLPALQLILVLILGSVLLRGGQTFTGLPRLGWPHILILQFALYFMINAWIYPSFEGNMRHFQRTAVESWGMTLFGFGLTWLYLAQGRDFMIPLQKWMPPALGLSFLIMSYFFIGPQGARAQAFSTNALLPPMWYLTLTLICFCNFATMTNRDKIIRLVLLGTAAIMCLYSGGRMILIIWLLCTMLLAVYVVRTRRRNTRPFRDLILLLVPLLGLLGLLALLDAVTGRTIAIRFAYTFETLSRNGLSSEGFFRLEIWAAALDIIKQYLPFGAGQVNERLLIHKIIEREWWFFAHQTYLSYLIAGGWIALVSGLLFQGAGFVLLTRTMMPAALGLVLVPGLNGLTDSVFQSFFSVQLYMLLILLLTHSQVVTRQVHPKVG